MIASVALSRHCSPMVVDDASFLLAVLTGSDEVLSHGRWSRSGLELATLRVGLAHEIVIAGAGVSRLYPHVRASVWQPHH